MRAEQPFEACPRYSFCNNNNCPLDPAYPNRYTDPRDPETKCTLAKNKRVEVAGKFPGILQYEGMTTREYAGLKAWQSKSPEEKEEAINRVKKYQFTPDNQGEKENLIGLEGGLTE